MASSSFSIAEEVRFDTLNSSISSSSSAAADNDDEDDSFVPVFHSVVEGNNQFDLDHHRRQFLQIGSGYNSHLFPEILSGSEYSLGFACCDHDEAEVVAADSDYVSDMDPDPSLPVRWDCLQLEDSNPSRNPNDEFEWEEVDTLRVLDPEADEVRNIEWEVVNELSGANPADSDPEVDDDFVDEGFVYTSDHESYEVLVGDIADVEGFLKGRPPAAKSAVESLPSIILTEEDVGEYDVIECAVCKDGILAGGRIKRLPCSHHYHKECILPWLGLRNSCPLCRYELPTDDPEYESWKARRTATGGAVVVA